MKFIEFLEKYLTRIAIFIAVSMAAFVFASTIAAKHGQGEKEKAKYPCWEPGYLEIHHISTGRGDAAFMMFPDGTTLLFDAGSLDVGALSEYAPLKIAPARPDESKRPGQHIATYISKVAPKITKIDYALISHFHSDHFGAVYKGLPKSKNGDWLLTGLSDVAEIYPIDMLIDRAYPTYDYPLSLRRDWDKSFLNYHMFVDKNVTSGTMSAASLKPGVANQIVLMRNKEKYPSFSVQNVAANGIIWTGDGSETTDFLAGVNQVISGDRFNENPLSLGIKISYGPFDYFTGGDMTGSQGLGEPKWFDVETPTAKAVGEVDALTLNHHGNRDATNANFLAQLKPRAIVQQSWISDHPGGEVLHRMISKYLWPDERDIFATHIHDETKVAIGPWLSNNYKSTEGHIVIRVEPAGQRYEIFVLDDKKHLPTVKKRFGPYRSRN